MNKKIIWSVIGIAVIIIIIVAINSGSSSKAPVKIGAIAPLTGWGAYWGEGYQKGISLAVKDIESSGGKVDVMVDDGATDAAKSASAAQELITVKGVNALAVEFTGPSSSVSPIALQNKVPLLYDAISKKIISDNPLAFKLYFDISKQCSIAADNLIKGGAKHIGGLIANLDFASECQSAIQEAAQSAGVQSSFYLFDMNTTDFRTIIAKMKTDGVDAIIPVFYEDNAIAFFKQRSDLKFTVPIFLGVGVPDGFTERVRSSVATSSIEGVMTYDQPISDSFKSALKSQYPSITESDYLAAAYGYDEVMYLYRAMSQCTSGDSGCIVQKLESDTYSGALQSSGFGTARILNIDPVYYRYTNGQMVQFTP